MDTDLVSSAINKVFLCQCSFSKSFKKYQVLIECEMLRGHPLSMYAKFSEKLTFLTP